MTLEIAFYIHGVTPEETVGFHNEEYDELHTGITSSGAPPDWPGVRGGAEWGWNFDDQEPPRSHRALAQAQRAFGQRMLEDTADTWDWTLNPSRVVVDRLRPIMFFGFGDMFYYTCGDGKWSVRLEVAKQIVAHIRERRSESQDEPISLTLLGHSAGSVIAFDFLYYVFSTRDHQFLPREDPNAPEEFRAQLEECQASMEELKQMARDGKLRLRRLVTFGSPISMLMFRSDALVEILSRDEALRPEDYGFTSQLPGTELLGPRWINIWDRDDPIAWPVRAIMKDSPLVEDVYIDVSDSASSAHGEYWANSEVHEAIAGRW